MKHRTTGQNRERIKNSSVIWGNHGHLGDPRPIGEIDALLGGLKVWKKQRYKEPVAEKT